jgi:hypothetical protein
VGGGAGDEGQGREGVEGVVAPGSQPLVRR